MNNSRQLLTEYAEGGSEAAFTELVGGHLGLVYSTALRLTDGDRQLAEDVTQIVFSDLARTARTLSKNVMLGGWLHRHACFVAANKMRSERRRRTRERHAAEMNTPEDHSPANLADIAPELDDAINRLNEDDRLAIILRFFDQRDFGGLGEELGISEEAARKRVSRALEKLHLELSRHGLTRSAIGLGAALGGGLAAFAPARTAAEIATAAMASVSGAKSAMVLSFLAASRLKLAVLATGMAAAIITPAYIAHRTEAELRRQNGELRIQVEQLTALQTTNLKVATPSPQPTPGSEVSAQEHELLRLRGEVGVLRDQLASAQAKTAQISQAIQKEPADISYSFPSIPMSSLLDVYKSLAGKVLTISPEVSLNKTIWLKTPNRLTRSEALRWTEEALHDQGKVAIVTNADGSLGAVPALFEFSGEHK